MKLTAAQLWRAVTTGIVTLVLSFSLLRAPAEICAILIRRQWPEAWFSGLIVWYFDLFAAILSIAIALFIGRFSLQAGGPSNLRSAAAMGVANPATLALSGGPMAHARLLDF